MGSLNYNPEQKVALDRLLLAYPDVSAEVVFGLPCYKINGVVFATLYGEGVGIKLPEARVKELLEKPGYVPFRPFGRNRGKEFAQITHENPQDYRHDQSLFEEAMHYVGATSAGQKGTSPQAPTLESEEGEQRFRSIAAQLTSENSAITLGKMMSEPALHYQRVPSGYDPNHRRADLLRYDGLYAFAPRLPVSDLLTPALVERCYTHFQQMAPIYHWLMKTVVTTEK